MTTNQDKKAPKEKKLTKAEQREDQITTAFYMLARVVDQNTQMFNAFIDTMSESPEPAKVPATRTRPTEPKPETPVQAEPESPVEEISQEQISNLLVAINNAVGVDKAKALLMEFNAVRVSEVPVESYPAFLKRGATFIHEEL
jgi:hypothetical protein